MKQPPFYFKFISEEATRYGQVILSDGTASLAFPTANVVIGYYDAADSTWKDQDGVDITFPVLYWAPLPTMPPLSLQR